MHNQVLEHAPMSLLPQELAVVLQQCLYDESTRPDE